MGTTPLTEMTIDTGDSEPVSQKPYPIAMKNYQWIKDEIEKLLTAKVICSSRSSWSATHNCSPKGRQRKMISYQLQSIKQGHEKVYLAHAKSGSYLFQTKWSKIFLNSRLEGRLSSHSFGKVFNTKRQLLICLLENMSMSRYPSD